VLAYGSGLHTFNLTGESILVFARLLQDATSDWESETGSTFANTPSAFAKAASFAKATAAKTADKTADRLIERSDRIDTFQSRHI
jgi:hypothetical protein